MTDPDRLDIEFKFAPPDAAGSFSGYASVFGGAPDDVGDVVAPGAFRRSLAEHKAAGTRPLLLWQHDPDQPIGVWTGIVEDGRGLKVSGRLVLETARGREAHALLKAGALDGLSIGYRVRSADRRPGGVRVLRDVELVEISLVSLPAAAAARVTNVKSAAGAASTRTKTMDDTEQKAAPEGDPADLATRVGTLEEIVAGLDERLKAVEGTTAATKAAADRIEIKLARPGILTTKREEAPVQTKAFAEYARRGEAAVGVEIKNLTLAANGGGYLAPDEFVTVIAKGLVQTSPIRQHARILTISAAEARMPKRTGTMTAAWVAETGTRTTTQPVYGEITLTPHEVACYVDVSNALLEDNQYNLLGELSADFAEEFGRIEGAAFVSGDGTGKPSGILADTSITKVTTAATAMAADDIVDLFHALPGFYAVNGVWGMNRSTIGTVRKLKSASGDYLWHDALSEGNPPTILGRPVVELPDMPDIAADALPILFGDLKQGYRIVDRVSLSVMRDPFSVATAGQTRFHGRRRVGGGVVKAEALRLLKIKAA